MAKVLVWMPVYNEERFLKETIDSVLAQTFTDFELIISDNHSTDDSWSIIKAADLRDARVDYHMPARHLAGIPHMKHMWDSLGYGQEYTIQIGGHDVWPPNYLETLVGRAEASNPAPAIVYADTWQINERGEAYARYKDVLQVEQLGRPMIPQYVIAGVNSPQVFGLWTEEIRRKVPFRHACSGWDHLIVTEAALHGPILFEGRTCFLMRDTNTDTSLEDYGRRHLSAAQLASGPSDYLEQLEWMIHCVDLALDVIPEPARPLYRVLLTSSMFATYMALRGMNLSVVPGAMQTFNARPEVQQCFSALASIDDNVRRLLS